MLVLSDQTNVVSMTSLAMQPLNRAVAAATAVLAALTLAAIWVIFSAI